MKERFAFALVAACLTSGAARADVMYEFHRIFCDSYVPTWEIELVSYWNIQGGGPRDQTSLLKLETNSNLYALSEADRAYDGSHLTWNCGLIEATIEVEAVEHSADSGLTGYYRAHPRLTVSTPRDGEIISKLYISSYSAIQVRRVRIYFDRDGHVYIEMRVAPNDQELTIWPLTSDWPISDGSIIPNLCRIASLPLCER